jgi:hypothetical protein
LSAASRQLAISLPAATASAWPSGQKPTATARSLANCVAEIAPRVDQLVQVEVQWPEERADDAPVKLLAEQRRPRASGLGS